MDLVRVIGKSRKNVIAYILLPPECQTSINLLLNTRNVIGISKSNKYVFARLNADTPLSGTTDMRDVSNACPMLKNPDLITTTKLRKYMATVSQVCVFN